MSAVNIILYYCMNQKLSSNEEGCLRTISRKTQKSNEITKIMLTETCNRFDIQ